VINSVAGAITGSCCTQHHLQELISVEANPHSLGKMVKSLGRRMIDVTQKARGRAATKYEFEIIPYFVGKKLPIWLQCEAVDSAYAVDQAETKQAENLGGAVM
jgi:hypothetical protein